MISAGGAESSVTGIRSGWKKFRELLPLFTFKSVFTEHKETGKT